MQNSKIEIFVPRKGKAQMIPLFTVSASCSFPSPAEDYIETTLDLNEYLVKSPLATFFVRVNGNSMKDANIFEGDILIVDRSKNPKNGNIVLAVVNGDFTVKSYKKEKDLLYLIPANPLYKPLLITTEMDFKVWGVVTYIIHKA